MSNNKKIRVSQNFSSEAGLGLPLTKSLTYKGGSGYIPFSSDSVRHRADNLYPQQLATLAVSTPTHTAAINTKQFMTYGQGFNLELLDPTLAEMFNQINDDEESANDLLTKISWDVATFNGFALKVKWNNDGKIYEIEHIPFTDVRAGKPNEDGKVDYYKVSNNWDMTMPYKQEKCYDIPVFNPKFFADGVPVDENGIPVPEEVQMFNAEQIIYYWSYKPYASNGMRYYPLPDYSGALDNILTEYSIGVANKSKIDNGIGGKYIVAMPYMPTDDQEQAEIDANFKVNFSGAANDGGIVITYSAGADALPQITKLDAIDAETYIALEASNKRSIISAHNIPSILVQVNEGGGFNNRADEMKAAYNLFQKTVIKSYQNTIIGVFKTVTKWMGFDNQDIQIIPFSLEDNSSAAQGDTSLTTN